jgi:hypothetical protein
MAAVAAIFDEWQSWSLKGTFLQSPPMSHQKIGPVDQIKDGGHLGRAEELIIEWNLPVVTPNKPQRNRINRPRHFCPLIDGNQIQDGGRSGHLGWGAELTIEWTLPLVTPNKPQKNRINRHRRLSDNWRKPNVYGHRRIVHDIMPPTFYDQGHKKYTFHCKMDFIGTCIWN